MTYLNLFKICLFLCLFNQLLLAHFVSYIDDYYFLIAKYFEGVGDRSSYCNIFSYSRGAEDGCENKIFFFSHTCQITVKI